MLFNKYYIWHSEQVKVRVSTCSLFNESKIQKVKTSLHQVPVLFEERYTYVWVRSEERVEKWRKKAELRKSVSLVEGQTYF